MGASDAMYTERKKYTYYVAAIVVLALFVSWIMLLLVVVPGLGLEVNGATRWIKLGPLQFQPSEITKIGMIVFYAGYLSDHKKELNDFFQGFIKPVLFLVPPIGILFFVQSHLSVSIVIVSVSSVMMLMAGARVLHFVLCGGTRSFCRNGTSWTYANDRKRRI